MDYEGWLCRTWGSVGHRELFGNEFLHVADIHRRIAKVLVLHYRHTVVLLVLEPAILLLLKLLQLAQRDLGLLRAPTLNDALCTDCGGCGDVNNGRERDRDILDELLPHLVQIPLHEIHLARVVHHLGKDLEVSLKAALRDEDVLGGKFRICNTGLLPFLDALGDVDGTGEECTVLESVCVAVLVTVEELQEVRAFGGLETEPRADGLVNEVPLGVRFLELINERAFASADIALNGDQNGAGCGWGRLRRGRKDAEGDRDVIGG